MVQYLYIMVLYSVVSNMRLRGTYAVELFRPKGSNRRCKTGTFPFFVFFILFIFVWFFFVFFLLFLSFCFFLFDMGYFLNACSISVLSLLPRVVVPPNLQPLRLEKIRAYSRIAVMMIRSMNRISEVLLFRSIC